MTRSKGPAEEVSLPPTRIRKDVSTMNEGKDKAQGQVQANMQSQQRTADTHSPFARPGSRAGTSTMPASEAGMQPAPSNPFARPDSRAGRLYSWFFTANSLNVHSLFYYNYSYCKFIDILFKRLNFSLIEFSLYIGFIVLENRS